MKHIRSAPYHPSSNGEAERAVRTFKQGLKTVKHEPGTLSQKLAAFLLSYRTTPHSVTNRTPVELVIGRRLRTRLDLLRPNLGNRIQRQASSVHGFNKETCEFAVGDQVMVRDYRGRKETWTPGVLVRRLGPLTYQVQVDELLWKRHIDQLRACFSDQHLYSEITTPGVQSFPAELPLEVHLPSFAAIPQEPALVQQNDPSFPDASRADHTSESVPVTSVERRYSARQSKKPDRLIESI